MDRQIPFTLLFEEPGSNVYRTKPEYDEDLDLSVVWKGNEKIPFITLREHSLGTQTITKMEIESTDRDAQANDLLDFAFSYGLGTMTFTDVDAEVTDSDPGGIFNELNTHTITAVHGETVDEDR
jgi:hypothetical protein